MEKLTIFHSVDWSIFLDRLIDFLEWLIDWLIDFSIFLNDWWSIKIDQKILNDQDHYYHVFVTVWEYFHDSAIVSDCDVYIMTFYYHESNYCEGLS